MKKHLIAMVLMWIFAAQLASCTGVTVPEQTDTAAEDPAPTLTNFRGILGEDDFCAVAHLGYLDGSYYEIMAHIENLGIIEAFPFLEISKNNYVEEDGGELYAIIPADRDAVVRVYAAIIDETDYTVKPDIGIAEFEGGKPILLKCNVSEIVPNVVIEIVNGENMYSFSPSLSGENGHLVPIDGVYDFSPYDVLFKGICDRAEYVFCDTWYTSEPDRAGYDYVLRLEMLPDGQAYYGYGPMYSEYIASYAGAWEYDTQNDYIRFALEEIPIVYEGQEPAQGYEPGKLNTAFAWEMTFEGLELTHTDGDEIFEGSSGGTFVFQLEYDFYGQPDG